MFGSTPTRPAQEAQDSVNNEERRQQLDRILSSKTFLASRQLRKFLEYVGQAAITGRAGDIKEYAIGTEVFGRQNFDPRIDTFVRTEAGRLRARLEAYYRNEGVPDEVLVEIPKGHYVPRFVRRGRSPSSAASPGSGQLRRSIAIVVGIILFVGIVTSLSWHKYSTARVKLIGPASRDPVSDFWARFVDPQAPPIVCFSNHTSLINASKDQLNYDGPYNVPKGTEVNPVPSDLGIRERRLMAILGPVFFNDGFSGTGEVIAVSRLTRVFTRMGAQLLVRRSHLLSSTDLRRHDVIFVGAPAVNGLLQDLPATGAFAFTLAKGGPKLWGSRILNRHPKPGEQLKLRSRAERCHQGDRG